MQAEDGPGFTSALDISIDDLITDLEAGAAAATSGEGEAALSSGVSVVGVEGHESPGGDTSRTACWGGELRGSHARCTPGFVQGKAHFKNKFCAACKSEGIDVPASRVRALTPHLRDQPGLGNNLRAGFWKNGPPHLGGGDLRILNNTITCDGPWLVVYRAAPPALAWEDMPENWVEDGMLRFSVAKGTLVPSVEMWKHVRKVPSFFQSAPKRRRRMIGLVGTPSGGGPSSRAAGGDGGGPEAGSPRSDGQAAEESLALEGSAASSGLTTLQLGQLGASGEEGAEPMALEAGLDIGIGLSPTGERPLAERCESVSCSPSELAASCSPPQWQPALVAAHEQVIALLSRGLEDPPFPLTRRQEQALQVQLRHAKLAATEARRWRFAGIGEDSGGSPFARSLSGLPNGAGSASSSAAASSAGSSAASSIGEEDGPKERGRLWGSIPMRWARKGASSKSSKGLDSPAPAGQGQSVKPAHRRVSFLRNPQRFSTGTSSESQAEENQKQARATHFSETMQGGRGAGLRRG